MDIVKSSIEKPVSVIVAVILVLIFGFIGLYRMPYQLSPTVIEPEISVSTTWTGATPYEVERDVIEEQEKALKGIPGLVSMESSSYNGRGTITLSFKIGTNVDDALLRVSNKLNEVPSYPENVEKPVLTATGAATSPVIWMVLKTKDGNPNPARTYMTFLENEVRQYLERVEGVADLFIRGGTEKEMHVVVRPAKLAAHGLTITDVINALRAENVNISAGTMGVGRRDYRIRAVGEFRSPREIADVVLLSTGQRRVSIGDVASVDFGYQTPVVAMIHNAKGGIAMGVLPEPETNILDLTDRAEKVVKWLNAEKLAPLDIYLDWVYDQRPYITSAIDLVKTNILIGGILAVLVLLVFLRGITSTIVVATAIPISIIGTFVFMDLFGRNLNVVSLAGIAFAVGMLVDNAIVVLENIDRHRSMGKEPFQAAYDGVREVWGAILASTVTTIAVFLPVVFVQEEAGQLFRDIAIAVTCAVSLSLFVSVSVIPMLSKQLFTILGRRKFRAEKLTDLGTRLAGRIMSLVELAIRDKRTRLITIGGLTAFSVLLVLVLPPKAEYLPQGNRNLVINLLIPPPGLSYEERQEIGKNLFETLGPHYERKDGYPPIKNMFYVGADAFMFFGAISKDEQRVAELLPLFTRTIFSIPGMMGVSLQAGIFQTRLGRARTVEVDVSGEDLDSIIRTTGTMFGLIKKEMPEAQVRPVPSLEVLYPEVRILPDRDRLRASGMTARDLGIALDVFMDGRKVGEFKQEGEKKIDLVVKASERSASTPEELHSSLIATPGGRIVPVSSLSSLERTSGITEIRHLERNRTFTLQVTPPMTIPLQEAMEMIDEKIKPELEKQGLLRGVSVDMSGVADKLKAAQQTLQWDFLLAALIAYLLMAALFENFIYPLIIMFTVPLAAAGGIIGLRLVDLLIATQPLDILTMLGFVILVGVVVNNAILLVHQTLNNIRDHGMGRREAVLEATRTRLRPIYMSATTSIFGMLPLVVAPGAGSELYRGLGSVILGGLAFSTVFTVFVIPSLLMFLAKMEEKE